MKPLEEQRGQHRPRRPGRRRWSGPSAGRRRLAGRPARRRSRRRAELGAALPRPVGHDAAQMQGEEAPPVAAPEPQGRPLPGPGMVREPGLRLPQAGLPHHHPLGGGARRRGREARRAHPPEGATSTSADRRRPLALELPRHQSGAHPQDHRGERRQPRARHADARRGHRGRPRRAQDPADGSEPVQGRRQHGEHARQGGLPQRADRADPVRALDRDGPEAAAPDRAALDQQVLRPRPQSREELHPLGGRRRG